MVKRRREVATSFFPEAMVTGFEHLGAKCENDPRDHHVLAAAIHEKVETIVTSNLRHYPASALDPWGIIAVHPGSYLITLFEHDRGIVVDKLYRLSSDRGKTFEQTIGRLAWSVPTFSNHVCDALGVKLETVSPLDWKK